MNKKLFGIVVIILVLIAGGTAFLMMQNEDTEEDASSSQASTDSSDSADMAAEPQSDATETEGPGQYVEYDEEAVATTAGTKLLFFHAPWCPQCRALEADIENKGVPSGVTIFKVDYDTNQGLRQKYGVTIQTTIVEVDENGNLIEKFVAYDDPTLESVTENLL